MLSCWKLIEWWNENKNEKKCEEEKKNKKNEEKKDEKNRKKKDEKNKNVHYEMWIKITKNVDVTRVMNAILRTQR